MRPRAMKIDDSLTVDLAFSMFQPHQPSPHRNLELII